MRFLFFEINFYTKKIIKVEISELKLVFKSDVVFDGWCYTTEENKFIMSNYKIKLKDSMLLYYKRLFK